MREIKFRAWDGESKIMVPVTHMWFSFPGARLISFAQMECVYETDDTPLMQYTGLKDKNGVEIYEGDIIRTDDSVLSDEVVVYDDAQYPALLWAGDQGVKESDRIEVIGNIYENPELLGGKDDEN